MGLYKRDKYQRYWDDHVRVHRLSTRQRLFYEYLLKYGFRKAIKLTGYEKSHGYRLLRHPLAEEYVLSLLGEAFDQAQLTLSELIKRRYELAGDVDVPPNLRDSIYKDLINMISGSADGEDRLRLTGLKPLVLKPSKEITEDADYEEEVAPKKKTGS